jgi:hypothetical protein
MRKSAQKPKRFRWNAASEEASLLVAQGELTNREVAVKVGVAPRTLDNWKADGEFQDRVKGHVADIRESVRRRGIAVMENRVRALQNRWERMNRVMDERAADPAMAKVPGGTTGLLVHNVKSIGAGMAAERVDLYELDAALLKEMREHEKQAAQELGQWSEKHEHHGADGQPMELKVTHEFDYESYSNAFIAFARERVSGAGHEAPARNGN